MRINVGTQSLNCRGIDLLRPFGIEALSNRDDVTVSNSDFDEPIAIAPQPSPANCDVKFSRHDCTTVSSDVSNGLRASRWSFFPPLACAKPNPLLCSSRRLIEDDRTERRGANTAHGKVARTLQVQIASTRRECRRDGDQVLWV